MIKIQNIYYMLTYAFQVLKEQTYASCATEPFENTADLFSAILSKGITVQIKRGLNRDYLEQTEFTHCPHGKIDMTASLKRQTLIKQELICTYDDFSINSYLNRILKTTLLILLKSDASPSRKKSLRKLLPYFQAVEPLSVNSINWRLQYNRSNQTYRMLISVCWLVINGMLQTQEEGSLKVIHFSEENMARLYEKFILEYYRQEYPQLNASPSQIEWAVDDGFFDFLPIMQTDVTLSYQKSALIIDAKYYQSHSFQIRHDVRKQHSDNLYQMFAYVKNNAATGYRTSGLILYAKTDEAVQPNQTYRISGNTISVKTLDLDCDFAAIKAQLNAIAEQFIQESNGTVAC